MKALSSWRTQASVVAVCIILCAINIVAMKLGSALKILARIDIDFPKSKLSQIPCTATGQRHLLRPSGDPRKASGGLRLFVHSLCIASLWPAKLTRCIPPYAWLQLVVSGKPVDIRNTADPRPLHTLHLGLVWLSWDPRPLDVFSVPKPS
jgi:hypothetical protein